jgi:hypothetical protein
MLTIRFRSIQFAALGIVLLTTATRLPSLQHPQAIDDEAPYSVVANEIVDGGRPYVDAVDRKPRSCSGRMRRSSRSQENTIGWRCT